MGKKELLPKPHSSAHWPEAWRNGASQRNMMSRNRLYLKKKRRKKKKKILDRFAHYLRFNGHQGLQKKQDYFWIIWNS
jgi:hypothetical protein